MRTLLEIERDNEKEGQLTWSGGIGEARGGGGGPP